MRTPVWVSGRVPNGYWSTRENRMRYMRWLGKRLRFHKTTDWYGLTRRSFLNHYGAGLLATVYQHSPLAALRDLKPGYDWKPWLMASTPQGYWKDPANRRRFMDYLGEQLGYTRLEDWYGLSQGDFHAHGGTGLLGLYYANSPVRAVQEYRPDVDWLPWRFHAVPQRFWRSRRHRRRYMQWLGEDLGFRKPEDWYALRRQHFYERHGGAMLNTCPHRSPLGALREFMPRENWQEWRFARVPNGFWRQRKNRHRFIDALGKHLGYRRLDDWYGLTREAVRTFGGGGLLSMRYKNSLRNLLRDRFPNRDWDPDRLYAGKGVNPVRRKRVSKKK